MLLSNLAKGFGCIHAFAPLDCFEIALERLGFFLCELAFRKKSKLVKQIRWVNHDKLTVFSGDTEYVEQVGELFVGNRLSPAASPSIRGTETRKYSSRRAAARIAKGYSILRPTVRKADRAHDSLRRYGRCHLQHLHVL